MADIKAGDKYGILPGEHILPEDYPVHYDFCYICDGELTLSPVGGTATVADLKRHFGVKEVRRANLAARGLL